MQLSHPSSPEATEAPPQEQVLTEAEITAMREELVSGVFRLLAIKRDQIPGYPVVMGHIANECLRLSACAPNADIDMNALDLSHEFTIVAGDSKQFKDFEVVLPGFLKSNPKIKQDQQFRVQDGSTIFIYGHGNYAYATIRLIKQPPGSCNPPSQEVFILPPGARNSVGINVSAESNPTLMSMWHQFNYSQFSYAGFNMFSQSLYSMSASVTENTPLHLFVNLSAQHASQMNIHQPTEPALEWHSQPVDTTQSAVETVIQFPTFHQSICKLNRQTTQEIDLSYDSIMSDIVGEKEPDAKPAKEKKKGPPKPVTRDLPKGAKHKQRRGKPKSSEGSGNYGLALNPGDIVSSVSRLMKAATNVEKDRFIDSLFSEALANKIRVFMADEAASGYRVRHDFAQTPYIGTAHCAVIQLKNHNTPENQAFAEQLKPILLDMIKEVNQKAVTGADNCTYCLNPAELKFLSALLIKHSCYCAKTEPCSDVFLELAKLNRTLAQHASNPANSYGNNEWRILPQTMLIMLSAQSSSATPLNNLAGEQVMLALGEIVDAACMRGDYDIASASTAQLCSVSEILNCYPGAQQFAPVFLSVSHYLSILDATMGTTGGSAYIKVCAANAAQDAVQSLQTIKAHWESTSITEDGLKATQIAAEEILQKQKDAIDALDKEVKEFNQEARKREIDAKEKLKAARKPKKAEAPKETASAASEPTSSKSKSKKRTPKLPAWEKHTTEAVNQYKIKEHDQAGKLMTQALQAAQKAINKACVYHDCGDAQIESCKQLIDLVCFLGTRCEHEHIKMQRILQSAQELTTQNTQAWLNRQMITSPDSLARLANKFPSTQEITEAAECIGHAITLYSQALEQLKACSQDDMDNQGQFILEIMEANMMHLFQKKRLIENAKENLSKTMLLRRDLLHTLGLFGAPRPSAASHAGASAGYQPQEKHWFTSHQERFTSQTEELSGLFLLHGDQTDKLQKLIEGIGELRRPTH